MQDDYYCHPFADGYLLGLKIDTLTVAQSQDQEWRIDRGQIHPVPHSASDFALAFDVSNLIVYESQFADGSKQSAQWLQMMRAPMTHFFLLNKAKGLFSASQFGLIMD